MSKIFIACCLSLCSFLAYGQTFGVKSNVLYDATTTFNLGVEVGLAKKWSLDVSGNYNPWEFSDNRQIKHWMVQPELRWWTCERFNGSFFALHGMYAEYNAGGFKLPFGWEKSFRDHRYDGHLWGVGIGYGYQWILSNHWGLEAEIGVGYARLHYDKYPRGCSEKLDTKNKNYFGPTKIALSFIYLIK